MYIVYVAMVELAVRVSFSRTTVFSAAAPENICLCVNFGSSVKNGGRTSQVIGV